MCITGKYYKILLLFLSLSISLYLIIVKTNLLGSDSTAYIQAANSLLEFNVFSSMGDPQSPDNFRTAGYPMVIALAMSISPSFYVEMVIILQVSLMLVMALKFISFDKFFKIRYTPIVFLPFMLHPEIINLSTSLQTEFMYVFTLFLFFIYTLKYVESGNNIDLILSALLLSFSLHIKPVYLFFVIVYLVFVFFLDRNFRSFFIALIVITITLSPWIVRNSTVLDTYSFTSSKNFNLLSYAYSITKEKYNLSSTQAVQKVDNLLVDRYKLKTDESILSLVSSQDNELINKIIPMAAKDIIFNNIEYFPKVYVKGLLRGFYLPHTIYNVDKDNSLHITNLIDSVKKGEWALVFTDKNKLDYKVLYFHFFPLILNFIALIGLLLFSTLWIVKKQFRTYQTSFILLFVWYGVLVAFPWSNNSRYMMAYFPQMAIMFLYSLNFINDKNRIKLEKGKYIP